MTQSNQIYGDSSALDPAVAHALEQLGLQYKVLICDPTLADTAVFCQHYGFSQSQSANAIIVATKAEPVRFACCIVLATTKLDVNKKVSLLLGTKKLSFATAEQTQALTGMQIGGVTPFGLTGTPIYIDSAVKSSPDLIFGGGNRASKVIMQPDQLHKIPNVEFVDGLAVAKVVETNATR